MDHESFGGPAPLEELSVLTRSQAGFRGGTSDMEGKGKDSVVQDTI